jgi:hypothetical protein
MCLSRTLSAVEEGKKKSSKGEASHAFLGDVLILSYAGRVSFSFLFLFYLSIMMMLLPLFPLFALFPCHTPSSKDRGEHAGLHSNQFFFFFPTSSCGDATQS